MVGMGGVVVTLGADHRVASTAEAVWVHRRRMMSAPFPTY